MTNIKQKAGAFILSLSILFMPMAVYGASLIPCGQPAGTPDIVVNKTSFQTTNPCGFNDLIILANVIVSFLMYDIAVPLMAIAFMYTGARFILFQNKEEEREGAKKRAMDVLTGFGIMLGAYVLIKTILYQFINTSGGYTLFLLQ